MTRRLLLGGLLTLSIPGPMVGCRPTEHQLRAALDEARYPDALAELRRLEPQVGHRSTRWQARYALQRGLAHLAVGDAGNAVHWLSSAWEWHEANPNLLTPADYCRLLTAWRSMGLMPGDRPIVRSAETTSGRARPLSDEKRCDRCG